MKQNKKNVHLQYKLFCYHLLIIKQLINGNTIGSFYSHKVSVGECVHKQVMEGNNESEQAILKMLHNLLKMKLFFVKFDI